MSDKKKKEIKEEDYLRQHLDNLDATPQLQRPKEDPMDNVVMNDASRTTDLQFVSVDVKELPCGRYYPKGTTLAVRAAQVREIQSYSMVDDTNIYDVVEKMNDMLQSCVRIKYTDGSMGSYLDLKDQDRIYTIFLIRELTFQSGNTLGVDKECTCGHTNKIELLRSNFVFHEVDAKIEKFYNPITQSFSFNLNNGKHYELTLPNIGLQKSFSEYIIKEHSEDRKPDMAFLKIIPFMLDGRNSITYEGIKEKLKDFHKMDDISFQFLNAAVDKLTLGIKGLKTNCEACGLEVHTDMTFPNGASGIFVIHDAFEAFIEK